jgi:hypothetical protein
MKYIELVKGLFTADHDARAKQADPYVAYSKEDNRLMLNFIPESIVGPANNEIWYTTTTGEVTSANAPLNTVFGLEVVSHTYENGKGILVMSSDIT